MTPDVLQKWSTRARVTGASLADRVRLLQPSHARGEYRALVALAQLASIHLKADAGPLLLALVHDAHPAHLQYDRNGVVDAVRWWARRYPKVAKPLAGKTSDRDLRLALDPAASLGT